MIRLRDVQTRPSKMPTVHVSPGSGSTLQEIADLLWKARKVVVVTGAGISTNSGIPVSMFASRFAHALMITRL